MVKKLDEIEKNTHTKPQETLEFKMTKPKQTFHFDQDLIIPEKWLMGLVNLQVYNTVYNITDRNNKLSHYIPGYKYESVNISKLRINNNLPKDNEKKFDELLLKYDNEIKIGGDLYYLSDLKYEIPRKNIIDGLKNINYGRKMENILVEYEYIDLLYRMELTTEEIEYILDFQYIEPETINYEIKPGIYEFNEIVNAFSKQISEHTCKDCKDLDLSLKIKADKKSMKTILETSHELIFNSNLNQVFGFTKKRYSPGHHISEKVINIMSVDKVHLKTDCIDGSIVNGIRESDLFSFSLSARPGYKIFKEPSQILFKKVNKDKIGQITFYLEDDDGYPVDFQSETITFTVLLVKI